MSRFELTNSLASRVFARLFDRKKYPCQTRRGIQSEDCIGLQRHQDVKPQTLCIMCKAYWLAGQTVAAINAAGEANPHMPAIKEDEPHVPLARPKPIKLSPPTT